jgi:hypothetical protein
MQVSYARSVWFPDKFRLHFGCPSQRLGGALGFVKKSASHTGRKDENQSFATEKKGLYLYQFGSTLMLIKGVLAFVTILVAECNLMNYRNITRIPIIYHTCTCVEPIQILTCH